MISSWALARAVARGNRSLRELGFEGAVDSKALNESAGRDAKGHQEGSFMQSSRNPLDETVASRRPGRDGTGQGKTIGLLDISKPGGSVFLDHLERLLKEQHGVAAVVRATKPTFTKPAPAAVIEQLIGARCDAVIEALAD